MHIERPRYAQNRDVLVSSEGLSQGPTPMPSKNSRTKKQSINNVYQRCVRDLDLIMINIARNILKLVCYQFAMHKASPHLIL